MLWDARSSIPIDRAPAWNPAPRPTPDRRWGGELAQFLSRAKVATLIGESFWIVLGQLSVAAAGMVAVQALTHRLSPAAFGELAIFLTVTNLLYQAGMGPLSQACYRYYETARTGGDLPAFTRGLLASGAAIAVAGAALVAIMAALAPTWRFAIILAAPYFVLSGVYALLASILMACRRQRAAALWQCALAWARPAAAIALVLLASNGRAAILGYVAGTIVIVTAQVIATSSAWRPVFQPCGADSATRIRGWMSGMAEYAWPMCTWGLMAGVQPAVDRWALGTYRGLADVGMYYAVFQIGFYPITLLGTAISQLILPFLFARSHLSAELDRALMINHTIVKLVIASTCILTVTALVWHRWILGMIVGAGYRAASQYLYLIVLSSGLLTAGHICAHSLLTGARTRALIGPRAATPILGCLLTVVGARFWGIAGVCLANLISASLYLAWMLILDRRARCLNLIEQPLT